MTAMSLLCVAWLLRQIHLIAGTRPGPSFAIQVVMYKNKSASAERLYNATVPGPA